MSKVKTTLWMDKEVKEWLRKKKEKTGAAESFTVNALCKKAMKGEKAREER